MARFDVYEFDASTPLVIEVQADLLSHLESVVVIPLVPETHVGKNALPNLNPSLRIAAADYRLVTTDIAAIPRAMLGRRVANAQEHRMAIVKAIDFLLQGF
jgi:toxin CcdB